MRVVLPSFGPLQSAEVAGFPSSTPPPPVALLSHIPTEIHSLVLTVSVDVQHGHVKIG